MGLHRSCVCTSCSGLGLVMPKPKMDKTMREAIDKWIADWLETGYEAVNIHNEKPPFKSKIAWFLAYKLRV